MNNEHIVLGVIQRIESKLSNNEKINLNDVAMISGFSKRYIQKIFKEQMKMSISSYIRKRRLTNAAILIKFTRKSLYHIAMDLNFSTQQSFSRAFYREFHESPLRFRNGEHFDCSKLLHNHAITLTNYDIRETSIDSLKLNVEQFVFKEVLLGTSPKRVNKFRFEEINAILSKREEAIVITTLEPHSKLDYDILLNVNAGYEDLCNFNYEISSMTCWEICFRGSWDEYIIFNRLFILHVNIKILNLFIERIKKSADDNGQTEYDIKIYIPKTD